MNTARDPMDDWAALGRQSWSMWQACVRHADEHGSASTADADADALNPGDVQQQTVERMLTGVRHWQDWLQALSAGDLSGDDWQQTLQQAFMHDFRADFPGIGPGREYRQWQRELMHALQEFNACRQRYDALMARANLAGLDELQHILDRHDAAEEPVDTLRALYELWVDCAERAYADAAFSSEFRDAYGALVDAQMRLRAVQGKQMTHMARHMGLPTRDEVDTLGQRLQQVRRELRALDAGALHDEVTCLRGEVDALRTQLATTQSTPAPKKTAKKRASSTSGGGARRTASIKPASRKR